MPREAGTGKKRQALGNGTISGATTVSYPLYTNNSVVPHPPSINYTKHQTLSETTEGTQSSLNEYLRFSTAVADHLSIDIDITMPHILDRGNSRVCSRALVDCGASANFISITLATSLKLEPLPEVSARVLNINDNELSPRQSGVLYWVTIKPKKQACAPSRHLFRAVPMKKHRIVLGIPWLRTVNLVIDWRTSKVTFFKDIQI